MIDFQDAVLGRRPTTSPPSCRMRGSPCRRSSSCKLIGLYARERKAADPAFDVAAFARAYAIMGAQRATKILGIFARLDRRDGKPHYLKHLPRIEAYLARNLAHPALAKLKVWYETYLPRLIPPVDDIPPES